MVGFGFLLLAQTSGQTVTVAAVLIAAALLAVWGIGLYNGLVRHANLVREGWSGIDVQLKRRHDLIPNLVKTVKGYSGFERSLLEDVTELRTRALEDTDLAARREDENALSRRLKSLFAVAEAYPQLQANQSFVDLQRQLAEIEASVQMARRYYNGAVRDYNIRIESFPSNLVAQFFRFERAEFFELETATEREVPRVEF